MPPTPLPLNSDQSKMNKGMPIATASNDEKTGRMPKTMVMGEGDNKNNKSMGMMNEKTGGNEAMKME